MCDTKVPITSTVGVGCWVNAAVTAAPALHMIFVTSKDLALPQLCITNFSFKWAEFHLQMGYPSESWLQGVVNFHNGRQSLTKNLRWGIPQIQSVQEVKNMICISGTYWMTEVEQEVTEILWDINQISMRMVVVLTDTDIKVVWTCFSLTSYWKCFILATCIEKQN